MAGPHPAWPYGHSHQPIAPRLTPFEGRARLGWLGDWSGAYPLAPGIAEISAAALAQMSDLGWAVDHLTAPFSAPALWEAWCDLRSFAVAGGRRADFDATARRAQLKPAMIWEIERGRALSAMQIFAASETRSAWFRRAVALFEQYDALLLPSAQLWPFEVGLVHPTEINGIVMDSYHRWMEIVIPASLIGLPVVNLPIGFGPEGLPAGLQLIGAPGSDAKLLRLAENWHQMTEWPQSRPALADA